jgi:hypothetical protein
MKKEFKAPYPRFRPKLAAELVTVQDAEDNSHEYDLAYLKPGYWWKHDKSGKEYQIVCVTSESDRQDKSDYPITISYKLPDGRIFSRLITRWFGAMSFVSAGKTPEQEMSELLMLIMKDLAMRANMAKAFKHGDGSMDISDGLVVKAFQLTGMNLDEKIPGVLEEDDIVRNAQLFDAMLTMGRIRLLGWAGFSQDGRIPTQDEVDNGYRHFGAEFWSTYDLSGFKDDLVQQCKEQTEQGANIIRKYAEQCFLLKNGLK